MPNKSFFGGVVHRIRVLTTKPHWPLAIYIVRHGEAEHLVEEAELKGRIWEKGAQKIELTERGVEQAIETGRALAGHPRFDVCIYSPSKRARDTAGAIVKQLGYPLPLKEDVLLKEKDLGVLRTVPGREREQAFPEELKRRRIEGTYYFRPTGGQSQVDVLMQINAFLDTLTRKYAGKRVLIVAHNSVIQTFKEIFGNLTSDQVAALKPIPRCGVNIFEIDRNERPSGKMKLTHEDVVMHSLL